MDKQHEKYRITNWKAYNKSLIERGDISIWLCPEALKRKSEEDEEKK